jgi:O-antigen/teichoic acid export membrane protein
VRQASIGLVFKLGSVGATFSSVPIALDILGAGKMGMWLVLLSVFQWITLFDLGIGAGARNEIARAVAMADPERARRAIATGWFYVTLIAVGIFAVVGSALAIPAVPNWISTRIFHDQTVATPLAIVLTGACMAFTLNFIQAAFSAIERPAVQSAYAFGANGLFVLFLLLGRALGVLQSVAAVCLTYALAMIIAALVTVAYFHTAYRELWPALGDIDHKLRQPIVHKGIQLFVIQLCALAIFTTDRLLVSAFVSPEAVVDYDAAYRIFALVTMGHALIMGSTWSSFTQAHARQEWAWIASTLGRLQWLMVPLAAGCGLLALLAPTLVSAWIGIDHVSELLLYATLGIAVVLSCWSNIFSYFLSAIGETRLQIYSSVTATFINFLASWYFSVRLELGAAGIVLGTCCAMLPFSILGPIVVRRKVSEGCSETSPKPLSCQ